MPEEPTQEGARPDPGARPEGDSATATQPEPPETEAPTGSDDGELGEAGKKVIADLRLQLKRMERERNSLAREKAERDDAERTELERVTAERDELKSANTRIQHEARARAAATEAGIPDLWDRLRGETEEELADDAKAMAERFGPRREVPDLGQGPRPPAPARGNADMNDRLRRAAGRS